MDKIRLDKALLNQISSRAKAQDMIKEGKISVNGKVITKASFLVGDEDDIVVTHTEDEFVSRGAFKLKGCLDKALLSQISSRAKAQDMIKEGKISVN